MRYSVPVNAASEVSALAAAGASELYCGYMDAWWAERYGDHDSVSRRQGAANIRTPNELKTTIEAAQRAGIPLHLALNTRYTEPMLDYLEELCACFEQWGGTGVILSDLGLMWRLRNRDGLTKTLSILAVAQNTKTVRAYARLGIARVVLPRFMEPFDAESLLLETPNIEAASMVFFDKCPWVDGYCRHRHGVSYPKREDPGDDTAPPLFTFDTNYETHACLGSACGYLVPHPCAACQLNALEDAGVHTAKLGGRGRPLEERLRALRFLRAAQQLESDERRRDLYRHTFGHECSCYFGPNTQSRSAIEPVDLPRTNESRRLLGSQTSTQEFLRALKGLCEGRAMLESGSAASLTLLVPPLSDAEQHMLAEVLPQVVAHLPSHAHIAVNDLGTLTLLSHMLRALGQDSDALPTLTLGTLLARTDDPHEVARFLSPERNPNRAILDLSGNPRTLTWARPPQTLVEHWKRPSNTEPSARQALLWLCGTDDIPYEGA